MKKFLVNAFSLQMISNVTTATQVICTSPATTEEVAALAQSGELVSAVGHPDTAAVLSTMLGAPVECKRVNVTLNSDDVLYVAQVLGGRLPEGATTLPEGFRMAFIRVSLQ